MLMLDRRAHPRSLTLKTGKIIRADEPRDIDCAILDLSDGARILVSDSREIRQKFLLKVDHTVDIYVCERVWKDGNRIGLSCHSAGAAMRGANHE
jgi:hypothetical protein